jgi:hypothetical protein
MNSNQLSFSPTVWNFRGWYHHLDTRSDGLLNSDISYEI